MDAPIAAPAGIVVVILLDYWRRHQAWGWMRLVAGTSTFKEVPGLLFAKIMGSGHGGGFTLRPSPTHQGLICRFSRLDLALDFLRGKQVSAMRERSREFWSGAMAVTSSRGSWDQRPWPLSDCDSQAVEGTDSNSTSRPLAVLTRASIVPSKAMSFWRYAPAAQADLKSALGCLLSVGLGEVPLVRQCTFSLWLDSQAMRNYATLGAHQIAAAAAQRRAFFSESLFVHMNVLSMSGQWQGRDFGDGLGLSTELAHA